MASKKAAKRNSSKRRSTAGNADKLQIAVGAKGLKVQSVGGVASKLSHQLSDLISPFSEGMGIIGDGIRLFRQKAAVKALERAHEISKERGHEIKPVPPKFLVEWLENASLQDDKDEALTDLWAELLASASNDFKTPYISYVDLLKKIGAEEAALLQFLAGDTNPEFSNNFYQFYFEKKFLENVPAIIERRLEREEDLTMGGLLELLDGAALQYNFQLLYLSQPNTKVLPTEFFKKHEKSCAVLEREGVMKIQIGSVEFGDSVLRADPKTC